MYFVAPVDSAKPTQEERWNHCMTTPGCKLMNNVLTTLLPMNLSDLTLHYFSNNSNNINLNQIDDFHQV